MPDSCATWRGVFNNSCCTVLLLAIAAANPPRGAVEALAVSSTTTSSIVSSSHNDAVIQHVLDTTRYWVKIHSNTNVDCQSIEPHHFIVTPQSINNIWECSILFQSKNEPLSVSAFESAKLINQQAWKQFWNTTGVIDFSGSKDTRAFELERRVILSQYLMHVQERGVLPPQETGLVNNSWFGKPHLEMTWWHLNVMLQYRYNYWCRLVQRQQQYYLLLPLMFQNY